MLFVALTRSSILELLPAHSSQQFSVARGWFLTCAADNFLSRLSVSADEIAVIESLRCSEDPKRDVAFITARFQRTRQRLQVARHAVSGRPVYHSVNAQGEFFLSTHIAWLRQAGLPIEEDPAVLPELLAYRTLAAPRSLFRGIRRLLISGTTTAQVRGDSLSVDEDTAAYDPTVPNPSLPESEGVARLANLLLDSVGRLKPAAPRVATLLSGGIDSSLLAAIARDRLSVCDTYSTSFPFDSPATNFEQKYALSAACALSTRHTLFTPTVPDFVRGVVEALASAETPLSHLQSVLLYLLFKTGVPGRLDMMLCGEGADTSFGQEAQFQLYSPSLRQRVGSSPPVYAALRALGPRWTRAKNFGERVAQIRRLQLPLSDALHPFWHLALYGDLEWIRTHYGASLEDVIASRRAQLQPFIDRPFDDVLPIYAFNHAGILGTTEIWSKLAEGQKKIIYYPYLTPEFLQAAFSIPWSTRMQSRKHVIRAIGRKLGVPGFILNRPKQSFGVASDRWAEAGGPLEPLIAVAGKVTDVNELRALQGTEPRKAMTLWSLLNYAVLKRLFLLGESKETLMDELTDSCRRDEFYRHVEPALRPATT
jgi:asparagine synthetase B (glutamine-hydrolysing)